MTEDARDYRVIGRYALFRPLASGGMATVHFGRLLGAVGFSRTVAIKRLHARHATDPELVAMFIDEARLAGRIRHPNVVPTLDVVSMDGELFLVMEYVAGESLSRLTRELRGRPVPPTIAAAIIGDVLQGLHAAHEARDEQGEPLGIVHRDVSPQNVLVAADGHARVVDFGVAKATGRAQATNDGAIVGKIAYMAPEQLRGEPVSRRADVFGASVILWELLTGRRLFHADNEAAVILNVLSGAVVPPSEAFGEEAPASLAVLDDVVMRGLALREEDRFATAREMLHAVERATRAATAEQVGEWVEGLAGEVLAARARTLAEIESHDAVRPPSGEIRAVSVSTSNDEPPTLEDDVERAPVSQQTVSSAVLPVAARGRRPTRFAVPLAAALVVACFVAVLVGRAPAVSRATPAAVGLVPARPLPIRVAPPGDVSGGLATRQQVGEGTRSAQEEPVKDAVAAPARAAAKAAIAATSAPPPPAAPAAPSPPAAPPPDCNPPYTWDARGVKHYKPRCL